jgi:hypothetical protein
MIRQLMKKPGQTSPGRPAFMFISTVALRPSIEFSVTLKIRIGKVKRSDRRTRKLRKTKFTFDEAVDVWLRSWSGQIQHEIAADYRINAGRVSEVLTEKAHAGSKRVAASKRSA